MGLIKAALGSFNSTMADQWKEFFTCDALENDVLVRRGQKTYNKRSSNKKGNDNVISNGSGIVVADGQCMMIVEQGKVVDICAEPGEFTYDNTIAPSLFTGKLGKGILDTFKTMGKRFTYGGDTGVDQRVYYFNTKEILDNKFGTPNPFMFDVVNKRIGMTRTVQVRCNGVYSYTITDPLLFYSKVCGNVDYEYTRDEIDNQLKTEFISALAPAFAKLSELELRPAQIPAHAPELITAMNEALASQWTQKRGISVQSIALNPITLTDEDLKKINQMEDAMTMGTNPFMMAGRMTDATASAMENAAANEGGAMNGFIGMGMAMNTGVMNQAQSFYNAGVAQQEKMQSAQASPATNTWKCSCGAEASGKFCTECGAKKPEDGWTCACGTVNKGKFCCECGAKKPAGALLYRCDKCGWEPEDPSKPPKFCPECGDVFDENDVQ
ncbi:MAG: SPFH domain-containing protein [Ruminococcaceae bacterium]|nr:SPFH domain-containing protein [Oscillospiraceae bacterium]